MTWISVYERWPNSEKKYYKCLCAGVKKPWIVKCKFKKEVNKSTEYSSAHFIHKRRLPIVYFWMEK